MTLEKVGSDIRVCGVKEEYMGSSKYSPDSDGCSDLGSDELLTFFGDIRIRGEVSLS